MSFRGLCFGFKDYPLYLQEDVDDPLIVAKLFDPCSAASWFVLEYDPIEKIAYCGVHGLAEDEEVKLMAESYGSAIFFSHQVKKVPIQAQAPIINLSTHQIYSE